MKPADYFCSNPADRQKDKLTWLHNLHLGWGHNKEASAAEDWYYPYLTAVHTVTLQNANLSHSRLLRRHQVVWDSPTRLSALSTGDHQVLSPQQSSTNDNNTNLSRCQSYQSMITIAADHDLPLSCIKLRDRSAGHASWISCKGRCQLSSFCLNNVMFFGRRLLLN